MARNDTSTAFAFAPSPRSTVGVEWELALVDQTSHNLSNNAPEILTELQKLRSTDQFPHFTHELLQNTIELVSAPQQTIGEVIHELRTLGNEALRVANAHGTHLIGSATHPFARWQDQRITNGERYVRFIDKYQWYGKNMLIWGVHIHVGVDRTDRVIPLLNALLTYLPHLLALSASSPFWAGEQTNYASNRTLQFQQLPTAGLPFEMESWADAEHILLDLQKTGVISEPTEARWDIRPAPKWGTLEIRFCDGAATLADIGTLAAVGQCLVEFFQTEADQGRPLPRLPRWFIQENKWRAARYGLDATVITSADGTEQHLRADLVRLFDLLLPTAVRLGCERELAGIHRILSAGNSAERQMAHFHRLGSTPSALQSVVAALAAEFRQGLSDSPFTHS